MCWSLEAFFPGGKQEKKKKKKKKREKGGPHRLIHMIIEGEKNEKKGDEITLLR